jgi:single-strand DNA-binding protein
MTAVNQTFLIGRIGQDPEVKYTKSGVAYCQVNLAVNRTTKDAAGNTITDWIPLQVWDKRAENFAKYVTKGQQISVTGQLQIESWEQNGEKRSKAKVILDGFHMLGSKSDKSPTDPEHEDRQQAVRQATAAINRSQNRDAAIDNTLAGNYDESMMVDDEDLPPF